MRQCSQSPRELIQCNRHIITIWLGFTDYYAVSYFFFLAFFLSLPELLCSHGIIVSLSSLEFSLTEAILPLIQLSLHLQRHDYSQILWYFLYKDFVLAEKNGAILSCWQGFYWIAKQKNITKVALHVRELAYFPREACLFLKAFKKPILIWSWASGEAIAPDYSQRTSNEKR